MIKLDHPRFFLSASRTAILFVAGFLIYEILVRLEKIWNLASPGHEVYHFYKRKTYKLILILIIDLIILYGVAIFLGIDLG